MTTETKSLPDKATKAESTPEIPHIVRKQAPEPSHRVTRSQAKGAGRDENTKAKERQRAGVYTRFRSSRLRFKSINAIGSYKEI